MGEEAMEGTDCRAKILSQDYRDFLIPGYREDIEVRLPEEKTCVQEGDFGLRVISADKETVGELSFEAYGYPAIPKCYALLDMDALNETGISTVQNYPALQLDGKGIMIGLVEHLIYFLPVYEVLCLWGKKRWKGQTAGRRSCPRITGIS